MKKTFDLYLVRHGESYNNSVAQSQRVYDPPLTELGQAQAKRLAERIRHQFDHSSDNTETNNERRTDKNNVPVLDRVYTSAFLRTMQTIHPTTRITGVLPEIWTDLFEVGGCFEGYLPGQTNGMPGMTATEIAQQFSGYKIPPDIDETGWWKSKPRETHELAEIRADKVVQQLYDKYHHTDSTVLCVIHGDLIRFLMRIFLPDVPDYGTEVTHNTSVTHLRFTADGREGDSAKAPPQPPQVLLFNDTSHLSTDMLSV